MYVRVQLILLIGGKCSQLRKVREPVHARDIIVRELNRQQELRCRVRLDACKSSKRERIDASVFGIARLAPIDFTMPDFSPYKAFATLTNWSSARPSPGEIPLLQVSRRIPDGFVHAIHASLIKGGRCHFLVAWPVRNQIKPSTVCSTIFHSGVRGSITAKWSAPGSGMSFESSPAFTAASAKCWLISNGTSSS